MRGGIFIMGRFIPAANLICAEEIYPYVTNTMFATGRPGKHRQNPVGI